MKIYSILLFFIFNLSIFSNDLKITDQSKSQVVCKNSNLELWIDAEGQDLKYQWFFNNQIIDGANYRILNIYNFDYSQTGIYHCIVSSQSNSEFQKSADILIYIASETIFIKRPENVMFQQNGTAKFETKIHTNQSITQYAKLQWYFLDGDDPSKLEKIKKLNDNDRISGATTENLTIKNTNAFDKGIYFCIAEGECGNDTSFAYLSENILFKIINLNKGYFDCTGGDAVLEAEVINLIGGELEFQWYKPGFKILNESKKYIGTKTTKLTITNVQMSDNNAYYLKVTHKESGKFARSEHFYVEPDMLPIIRSQPQDYLILDREANPTNYGQTYVGVFLDNLKPCTFKWYRNDTLVRTTYGIGKSDYFLGGDMQPRPAKKTDVGVYQCEVINECGTSWSRKAKVIWGLEPVDCCINTDAVLLSDSVSKDTSLYKYFWFYNNQLIIDNAKYKNSNTNKLTIKNIKKEDKGAYHAYLQANNGGLTSYLGKVYLTINFPPEVTKQLPDTMYLSGKYIKKSALVVRVTSPILSYQYFNINNESISNIINKQITNLYEENQIFYHGGPDLSLEDGTYYIKFWNNCGETRTKNFTISRTEAPVGMVLDSSLISSVYEEVKNDVVIYPNPANEFITINLSGINRRVNPTVELNVLNIEIYNSLGELLNSDVRHLEDGGHLNRIDVSNLSPNVYFIKIVGSNGGYSIVKKFVKY